MFIWHCYFFWSSTAQQQLYQNWLFSFVSISELFIQNVFSTLCTEVISVSQNQTASNIVEHLLKEASLDHLISFGRALSSDWELACTDRFASHVTQTFTLQLGSLLSDSNPNEDAFSILTELYSFLMSNLAYHMQHTYTSHIVRVMIEILGSVRCSDSIIRSRVARQNKGLYHDSDVASLY